MRSDFDLVRQAVDLIWRIRSATGVGDFCRRELSAHERRLMRERLGFELRRTRIGSRTERVIRRNGGVVLEIPLALNRGADCFLEMRFGARRADAPEDRVLHEVVAFAAAFPPRRFSVSRTRRARAREQHSLHLIGDGWFRETAPGLWRLRGLVLDELAARDRYDMGVELRRSGEYSEAEKFFGGAIKAARKTGERPFEAAARVGLGRCSKHRGNLPQAVRRLKAALRMARAIRAWWVVAGAAHSLGGVLAEVGDHGGAARAFRVAYRAYPRDTDELLELAHDIAFLWAEQGEFLRAARLLRSIAPRLVRPASRMMAYANLARSCACAGAEAEFDDSAAATIAMIGSLPESSEHARSLLALATGAQALQRGADAQHLASEALRVAVEHGEGRIAGFAEMVLNQHEVRLSVCANTCWSANFADEVLRELAPAAG